MRCWQLTCIARAAQSRPDCLACSSQMIPARDACRGPQLSMHQRSGLPPSRTQSTEVWGCSGMRGQHGVPSRRTATSSLLQRKHVHARVQLYAQGRSLRSTVLEDCLQGVADGNLQSPSSTRTRTKQASRLELGVAWHAGCGGTAPRL